MTLSRFGWVASVGLSLVGGLLPQLGCTSRDVDVPIDAQESAVIGRMRNGPLDRARTTHILAIGYSHGQGDQFARAALSRALRYREAFPERQIVVLGSPETGSSSDAALLRSFGLEIIEEEGGFSDTRLLERMSEFQAIASFDFFGHSSPWAVGLDSTEARLGTSTSEAKLVAVRSHFTRDAYATLNGCNAGYFFGPALSKLWKIPVSAALTGSNFQELHVDGKFYFNDDGVHPAGPWASSNARSYRTEKSCDEGACYRMKPENTPYNGYWGDFSGGGLGFYEFFCNYPEADQTCRRTMALSLYGFPSVEPADASSTRAGFERVVFDYLCPNDVTGERGASCRAGIAGAVAAGSLVYSSFRGNPLECADSGCTFELDCARDSSGTPTPGTCTSSAPRNAASTSLVRTYKRLMEGYDEIHTGAPTLPTAPTSPTALPTQTLETVSAYAVLAASLNCRSGPGTENAIELSFDVGERLIATTSPSRPRIQFASNGQPWILVRRGESAPCYVSAQLRFLQPLP